MGSIFDDLEDASEAEIRALMAVRTDVYSNTVEQHIERKKKLRIRLVRRPTPVKDFEPDITSVNEPILVSVELPRWMVVEMGLSADLMIREAVRDYLRKLGKDRAYLERFSMAQQGVKQQAASRRGRNRFTYRSRGKN